MLTGQCWCKGVHVAVGTTTETLATIAVRASKAGVNGDFENLLSVKFLTQPAAIIVVMFVSGFHAAKIGLRGEGDATVLTIVGAEPLFSF